MRSEKGGDAADDRACEKVNASWRDCGLDLSQGRSRCSDICICLKTIEGQAFDLHLDLSQVACSR